MGDRKVDLWEGEEIVLLRPPLVEEKDGLFSDLFEEGDVSSAESESDFTEEAPAWAVDGIPAGKKILLHVEKDTIYFFSYDNLRLVNEISRLKGFSKKSNNLWKADLNTSNAFSLRYCSKSLGVKLSSPEDGETLRSFADEAPSPQAGLNETNDGVKATCPNSWIYMDILKKVDAYSRANDIHTFNLRRFLDFQALNDAIDPRFPKFSLNEDLIAVVTDPIPGFDGTLKSLRDISIGELNIIKANKQTKAERAGAANKSLQEKMEEAGYATLHDLIMTIPRRYIDKSQSQDLRDLVEGEECVVIGVIDSASELKSSKNRNFTGAKFIIKTEGGKIDATFFNQNWLLSKFSVGEEVIVNGKVGFFRDSPQIKGVSIDHSDDAAILPVVPIYKQAPSKGITTKLILSALREMMSRIGDALEMPEYFKDEQRLPTGKAFAHMHFPNNPEEHQEALDVLAFYEMCYIQMILQETRNSQKSNRGISMPQTDVDFQNRARNALPFSLTNAQSNAIDHINSSLDDSSSSSILINADVGAGKSAVAFLSALRAVESGCQVAILAPTEVLARQLYSGLERFVAPLGGEVSTGLLVSSMKVREKKPVLKGLETGEVKIVVGTHALSVDSVRYHNLGLIIIDEQQKFGSEARSKLLSSREDELMPDMIMQTATPIPRSTAQAFFGDIEMIVLDEKPPGRIPIETVWIQENPTEVVDNTDHAIWKDLIEEAKKGNQSFVVTSMVQDFEKIDAASVETAFKTLSTKALKDLRVGYVHGKMKSAEQQEAMQKFRDKKYDVMVASMVVEVGVDIPDATRVVILSAERMGAASLHQTRGRVGRNSKPSKCYLVSMGNTRVSQLRLQSIVDHADGFDVAQADLQIRGAGTMLDSSQKGKSEMKFGSVTKHMHLIEDSVKSAKRILSSEYHDQALQDASEIFVSRGRLL